MRWGEAGRGGAGPATSLLFSTGRADVSGHRRGGAKRRVRDIRGPSLLHTGEREREREIESERSVFARTRRTAAEVPGSGV